MNKKIQIVHLITSLQIGGAETWLVQLIKNLPATLEHHIIFFYDGPNRELLERQGCKLYHMKSKFLYNPLFVWRIYTTIKRIQPALIHSSLWSANFIGRLCARLLHIPIICSIHAQKKINGTLRNLLDYCNIHLADTLVAVSGCVAQSMPSKTSGALVIINNGIDYYSLLHEAAAQHHIARTTLGFAAEHDFVIGAVGRFIALKNFSWLLDNVAQLQLTYPTIKLLLIGVGPQENQLRQQACRLNIENIVTFIVGQPATPYYPLMNCFVLPSQQEGLSMALLEAMSFKLPCIVAHDGKLHDVIVHQENGFLMSLYDNSFQQIITTLLHNKSEQERIGLQAYKSVQQHFCIKKMSNAYYQLYQKYF